MRTEVMVSTVLENKVTNRDPIFDRMPNLDRDSVVEHNANLDCGRDRNVACVPILDHNPNEDRDPILHCDRN